MKPLCAFEKTYTELQKERRLVYKSLSRCPEGDLMVTVVNGKPKIFQVINVDGTKKRRGIGRDPELIGKLSHKALLKEKLRRIDINIRIAKRSAALSLSLEPEELLAAMPKHFDLLNEDIILTGRNGSTNWPHPSRDPNILALPPALTTGRLGPEEWAALPYCENTSHLKHKIHKGPHGILCRSKSEVLIVEIYYALNIPFHYDETISVGAYTRSPDFIGARPDGKLIYHEHAGRNDDDYMRDLVWKLKLYDSVGIRLGKNLILTFDNDDGSLDLDLIRAQLKAAYFG